MTDRKNYSKRREEKLYSIIHDELIKIRMDMLRGGYARIVEWAQEERFAKATEMIGDKVCAEYRRSYAAKKGTNP